MVLKRYPQVPYRNIISQGLLCKSLYTLITWGKQCERFGFKNKRFYFIAFGVEWQIRAKFNPPLGSQSFPLAVVE